MDLTELLVLSPAASADPAVAIAACRAGARGTLDLEFASGDPTGALSRLALFADRPFGVQIGADAGIFDAVLGADVLPSWVVLAGGSHSPVTVKRFRDAGIEVLVEAVTLTEAGKAVELAADGIVLKGHEAGGRVGADAAFILVQKWKKFGTVGFPFWVRGGIGANTAAACQVAGAKGVVLDSQVLLSRESPVSDTLRRRLTAADGSETAVLGERLGESFRVFSRADTPTAHELAKDEDRLLLSDLDEKARVTAWREAIRSRLAADPDLGVWPAGQDLGTASGLAAKFVTVAGIVKHIADTAAKNVTLAAKLNPVAEGSLLAKSHKTRFPILQGPMTRVSDTPGFAASVAAGGGLPFQALALLRKAETEKLLAETKAAVGDRPWGVGILGFMPPEIRTEQIDAVKAAKPPFAIIAGGRPDQAKDLEAHGIATYLHVPSPGLLKLFLKDGAKRFIFEGRECGGHVGPRSSFALWEAMTEVLAEHAATNRVEDLHVVFAGGIHDGLSGAMVAALSAGLAEKGVKVGVLMGTAYLFTLEAVAGGAITPRFQKEAVGCDDTILLETGPGHAIRCIPTPYADVFDSEKRRLKSEGKSPLEVGLALERMNLGRLRVASKGVDRGTNGSIAGLIPVADDDQFRRGMYMIGQVAALRSDVTSVAELHAEVSAGSANVMAEVSASPTLLLTTPEPEAPPPCDIAIIGLASFYPGGGGLWPLWDSVLAKNNAVIEIPASHWDWRAFYDPDPRAKDKMVSKWGGFLSDQWFDPLDFGITPKSIPNIEPLQLLLLQAVKQAVADAGYADRPFARERTAAILGVGGGGMPLSVAYGFRSCMPLMDSIPGVTVKAKTIIDLGDGILPEWTEDSFPGILLNVAAGRVANRFNLGGPNMAIDAACGSSLAALQAGIRELEMGTSDVAFVMGADTVQTPYAYIAFSKTHALSPKGRCRPFDAAADGIALAEGIGVAVLKRLKDAERDGDRIYSVIKGIGASSDGRDKGLTAPRPEGQLRALQRAYAQARVSPARVGLVEAHGTGTVVGDQTEANALGQMFTSAGADSRSCALGSIKSMIGHSKCAAGLAGLVKAAFALHHKILPPTLAEKPNPKANLDTGPLYLNTEARPWVHGAAHPRTAGVSAFGFGGTNFHAVLEEYTGDFLNRPVTGLRQWPAELFVWRRADKAKLTTDVTACRDAITAGASPTPAALAASLWNSSKNLNGVPTLAVVATSLEDLKEKIDAALKLIGTGDTVADPRGIYFAAKPEAAGKVAFLFPGQGSQYPDMLAQVAMAFPDVRETLDAADRTLAGKFERSLGKLIYPASAFSPEQDAANRAALQRTEVAQPALGATGLGMFKLLTSLGIEPDALAGHSYGEYVALAAAGAMSDDDLIRLSHRRGDIIQQAAASMPGGMAAVDAPVDAIEPVLKGLKDVWVANHNAPQQTVIAGTDAGVASALEKLQAAGLRGRRIPVACAFHSPLVAPAKAPLASAIADVKFATPRKPVYSNTTAAPHDPATIATQLADHLVKPVRFRDEILAMHAAGVRTFVEVGPQGVLTGLTQQTLAGKPHLAIASDAKGRPGLVQLAHLLGQLLIHGVSAKLDRLYVARGIQTFDPAKLGPDTGKPKPTATTWVVNGVRSRPINGPEPRLLGQTLPGDAEAKAKLEAAKPTVPTPSATPAPQPVKSAAPAPTPIPAPVIQRAKMTHTEPAAPVAAPVPAANGYHTHAPANGHAVPADAAQVMMRFQDVMNRFLDTQRSVMLSYLESGAAPTANGTSAPAVTRAVVPAPIAERFAAPEPRLAAPIPTPAAPVAVVVPPAPAVNGKHAVAEVTPTKVAEKKALPDLDTLLAQLLDLVSERTGYPKEALSIDLDLEADLGVDSIKRVEILGTLAESLDLTAGMSSGSLKMEELSAIKTLRGIAEYVLSAVGDPEPALAAEPAKNGKPALPPAAAPAAIQAHPGARQGDVQRLVVRLIDAPLPARPKFPTPAGTVLVTDDRQGTARELADRLGELDVRVALVQHAKAGEPAPKNAFAADLTDPASVSALLDKIRAEAGPVAGLIHLLPLADEIAGDRVRTEVKSLYLLARGLEADIREAGKSNGGVLLSVTGLGGQMGFGELPDDISVGHGGVSGFTKCLGYEWPEVAVRVLDVNPETPATRLAELILSELGDPDGPFEVGCDDDARVTWQCDPGPIDKADATPIELSKTDTVLITGGARGVTAKVALEFATRFGSKLVLVGSSLEPTAEPAEFAGLTAVGELKPAIMMWLQAEGKPSAPANVESAFQRLKKDREIRGNLAAIKAAGGSVEYKAIDVRDAVAFGALIDDLNAKGGIAGVVHGAGVIEDKLLKDKTPESFDRVFGTKVDSALTLAAKLDPKKLKFFSLFASITSRYGNRGQSDYAAANEVLSKLAADLDRKWPARVVSIAWGPWSEVGMVADLEKHLVARGLKLIEPSVGANFAVDEVIFGEKGEIEVIVAGGTDAPSRVARPAAESATPVAVAAE